MNVLDAITSRLNERKVRLREEIRLTSMLDDLSKSDAGRALVAILRERRDTLARDYDASTDHESTCRTQGARREVENILCFIEQAGERLAQLVKEEKRWATKRSRTKA